MNILVVEDDPETANFLQRAFREAGWDATHFAKPQEALLHLASARFDAIVLDRMLPGMDGLDALRLLRGAQIDTPVIMLTAMSGIDDRVEGLEAGADDYLVKPFAISELLARIKTVVRRPARSTESRSLNVGPIELDRHSREVTRAGTRLDLSPIEYKLLEYLMRHPDEVITRTLLLEQVWGYRFDPKTSLVQTHMSRLRAKLDKPFEGTDMIETVRGSGYVLKSAP